MNGLLALLTLALCISIAYFVPVYGATAILTCLPLAIITGFAIARNKVDGKFLLQVFVAALLVRLVLGTIIFLLGLQEFFGGDAITYDEIGYGLMQSWLDEDYSSAHLTRYVSSEGGSGWGMIYMVAAVYRVIGRNPLAIQFVNAVAGAATAVMIFLCAHHIFGNKRVARVSALFVAFYPSLVLWSSQGLKDGPLVFLLSVCMIATLKLTEKLDYKLLIILGCALFGVRSLRFYVFYMVVAAVAGAFVIGSRAVTAQSIARQFVVMLSIGLAMTYFGVLRSATTQFETFGNLEAIQRGRLDQAQTGQSSFAKDVDVSTTSGALTAIPIGVIYLLFAPFPWQAGSLRQSITLPEMLIWYASVPLLILGMWFTLKFRLRLALPILIFTSMLTVAYSLFQGNVGTAYRQRSQLLVFYFIFVAVGVVLLKEKKEDDKQRSIAARQSPPSSPPPRRQPQNI